MTGLPACLPVLQHNPIVALAARDPLAVQEFEQGNGVLARDAGPFLEISHVETRTLSRGQQAAQRGNRGLVKNQIGADSHQPLFTQKLL